MRQAEEFCEQGNVKALLDRGIFCHVPWPRPGVLCMTTKSLPTKYCNHHWVIEKCRARAGPGPDLLCRATAWRLQARNTIPPISYYTNFVSGQATYSCDEWVFSWDVGIHKGGAYDSKA